MIREQRLKNVRTMAADAVQLPRAVLLHPEKPKKHPAQAIPAVGNHRRSRPNNPILPETIERIFEGGTAVLFATGPSLTSEVVTEILNAQQNGQQLYLFGCNDAYKMLPMLDVHYACDFAWWRQHFEAMREYRTSAGMWTQEPSMSADSFPGLRRIAGCGGKGLSRKQDLIHFGNNSGYQLINLAYLFGIKNMILCGYNMQVVNNKRHFFGDHPQGLNRNGGYNGFVSQYRTIHPEDYGIEIINATPDTALDAFPIMGLTEALKKWE